jgi:nucleotide-binding universal stress UspA family protein
MKTILIPVDFTATSENAVTFAARWSKRYEYDQIILLKSFYDSMFENIALAADYSRVNQDYLSEERENAEEQMQDLRKKLTTITGESIQVTTVFSELPLLRAVVGLIEEEKPELLLMGSDHSNYSSGSFIAANLISIAKASPIRVLIVPADFEYQPVHNALVPFDFNLIHTLEKLHNLRQPQWKDIKLLVLNVDLKQRHLRQDEKFIETEKFLHQYLEHFQHEIYYDNDKNIINGIINFTTDHEVDLIIALPGQRSFLSSLTHKSISEALYQHARHPVLILK